MAKQTIDIGASDNDGGGDPLRTAFDKTNDNFDELYGALDQSTNTVTTEIDWALGNFFSITPSGDVVFTFANAQDGQSVILLVDNAGDHNLTFPAGVKWEGGAAPTVTATEIVYTFIQINFSIYGNAGSGFATV